MERKEEIKKVAEFQYEYIGSTDEKKAFKQGVLTGAEWADKNPDGSIIKWQTGLPKKEGAYLVTTIDDMVTRLYFNPDSSEIVSLFKDCVDAWCKLSDIKPYKEDKKMKTFSSYDYTLCDKEECNKKETCKRWLTYRKAQEENYPYRLSVNVAVGAVTECEMYVETKEEQP